jgi:hypothetical protein
VKRSRQVTLAVVPVLAAAFAGCDDEDETAYCVDQNDVVVENRYCEDERTSGGFFWFFGGAALVRGQRVPTGGERIRANDRDALARRGGFGSSARSGGVGRPVGSSGG